MILELKSSASDATYEIIAETIEIKNGNLKIENPHLNKKLSITQNLCRFIKINIMSLWQIKYKIQVLLYYRKDIKKSTLQNNQIKHIKA